MQTLRLFDLKHKDGPELWISVTRLSHDAGPSLMY